MATSCRDLGTMIFATGSPSTSGENARHPTARFGFSAAVARLCNPHILSSSVSTAHWQHRLTLTRADQEPVRPLAANVKTWIDDISGLEKARAAAETLDELEDWALTGSVEPRPGRLPS